MLRSVSGDVPDPDEFWLWLGCFGLTLGWIMVAVLGFRARTEDKSHFVKGFFVNLVASCSYFAMASGQLDVSVGGDFTAQLPRYIDWTITTPLLLLSICLVALPPVKTFAQGRERTTLVAGLLGADVFMIVTGIFATLNETPWIRWTWFAISTVAFLAVLWLLTEVLKRGRARSGASAPNTKLAGTLSAYLVVLWLAYPIVWALGPQGAELWGEAGDAAIFALLDITAKTGFNLLLGLGILRLARMVTHEHGKGTIDEVSSLLGDGEDHRFHELGETPEAARAAYVPGDGPGGEPAERFARQGDAGSVAASERERR